MTYISSSSSITEDSLPIALFLYSIRDDVEKHDWNEEGTWRFVSGVGKRHQIQTATCKFIDAVAAFLLGEISDYFDDWISQTLEQIANCGNGKIVKVVDTKIKCRSDLAPPLTPISKDEFNILTANGFHAIGI
jgi:hypothetical protein